MYGRTKAVFEELEHGGNDSQKGFHISPRFPTCFVFTLNKGCVSDASLIIRTKFSCMFVPKIFFFS